MKIDKDLIKKVADLSRLNLTDSETVKFTEDFKDIIDAFKVLDEIDVSGVKSSFRPIEERNALRDDRVLPSIKPKDALKFSKDSEGGFFIGPRTIE